MVATDIRYESVVTTSQNLKKVDQFYPQSVVFVFEKGVQPLACDLDYLFAETTQHPTYPMKNMDKGYDATHNLWEVSPTLFPDNMNRGSNKYKFIDVIKYLDFKYGIKHEYYKNIYGKWVDMGAVKPYLCVENYNDNIFKNLYTGTIDNSQKETSVYHKICDHYIFEFSTDTQWKTLCELDSVDKIPECKYYVKNYNDNTAYEYTIGRGDGTCETEICVPKVFVNAETNVKTGIQTADVKFTYSLYNHSEKSYPTGNYTKNDHHKFDDIILTFTDNEGNGFTDLNDIFITVNGMVYDYVLGPNPNQITLNDVVKYSARQIKSIKSGYNTDSYLKYEESSFGKRIMNYDLPYEAYGYNYEFDINIYKWDNVSISHFIQPVTTKKLLKTEPTELNKSLWLVDTLVFSEMVDKDKCILLCGNTIVDKDTWHVQSDGSIKLDTVSIEFDLIYSEMWKRMQEYQMDIIGHITTGAPTLDQFLKDNSSSKEEIDKAYEMYKDAMDQWRKDNNADNWHYTKSPFVITEQQFNKRQYAIIRFDSVEPKDFSIEVTENRSDIELNKPYHNKFRNKNWSLNDIVVANGVIHRFVNEYADVFIAPQKWYRPETFGIFDDASAYKLQIGKRRTSLSIYHKLNYIELLNGPVEGNDYYTYSEERKTFLVDKYLTEFKHRFVPLNSAEISLGMDTHTVYFNKIDDEYVRVPQTQTEFKEDTKYYICEFLEDYYIKRK